MTRTNRILAATVGVPILLALSACGGYGNDPYGDAPADASNISATGTPEATADAEENAGANGLEAPTGIPTSKLIGTAIPKMGKVVTDEKNWVLYRFDKDTAKPTSKSACSGQCAVIWPPVLTDGNPTVEGISRDAVGTVTRDDGTTQLTVGGWPVYRYIGDTKAGQWTGQMVGGTWFVVAPDGKKNVTCLPTATPAAAQPPAPANATPAAGGNNPGGGY